MIHTSNGSSFNIAEKQDNNNSSEELIQKVEIDDTPFTAIRFDGKWFLTMGKYRLTEPMETLDEILQDAQRGDWIRIMQIAKAVAQDTIEEHYAKQRASHYGQELK